MLSKRDAMKRRIDFAYQEAVGLIGVDAADKVLATAQLWITQLADATQAQTAIGLLTQIEVEFPTRSREVYERAHEASVAYGTPFKYCMLRVLQLMRADRDKINLQPEPIVVSMPMEDLPDSIREEAEDDA